MNTYTVIVYSSDEMKMATLTARINIPIVEGMRIVLPANKEKTSNIVCVVELIVFYYPNPDRLFLLCGSQHQCSGAYEGNQLINIYGNFPVHLFNTMDKWDIRENMVFPIFTDPIRLIDTSIPFF